MGANGGGLAHCALLYRDEDEFLAGTVPFVHEGFERDEAILVALPGRNLALLRGALGSDAERVAFSEMEVFGRNPARLIPAWRDILDGLPPERGAVRGIGEPIWAGRSAAEIDECARHESLVNFALADAASLSFMCPYDVTALDDQTLATAAHTHPALVRGAETATNPHYLDPLAGRGPFAGTLEPPTAPVTELAFTIAQLADLRRLVADAARAAGLDGEHTDDLVIAATEIATNGVRHGGGGGIARLWCDERILACEISSGGRLSDPLAGRVRPPQTAVDGRGLWIANQLCDLVQIRSGDAGTVVRLLMDRRR
jgi:anti-sigma regulatory factor (Ser/Thr protein kinase)